MSERYIEVLEVFAEAGAHDRLSSSRDGRWQQWMTPDHAALYFAGLQAEAARLRRQEPAVALDTRRAVLAHYHAHAERLRSERRQTYAEARAAVSPDRLGRLRALCSDCKKRPPGGGWCPDHEEKRMIVREPIPDEAKGLVHKFTIYAKNEDDAASGLREVEGYIHLSNYDDGRLGWIRITMGKAGSSDALMDQWASAVTHSLQLGVSVRDVMKEYVGQRFEPSGGTKSKEIPRCTSVLDYVARFVVMHYDPEYWQQLRGMPTKGDDHDESR